MMTPDACYYDFMKEALEAVYENGAFRPLKLPEGIAEHRHVALTVTAEEQPSSLADVAGRISPDDAREMREIVEREFERVDARESQEEGQADSRERPVDCRVMRGASGAPSPARSTLPS